jgi:hypothetical protein
VSREIQYGRDEDGEHHCDGRCGDDEAEKAPAIEKVDPGLS